MFSEYRDIFSNLERVSLLSEKLKELTAEYKMIHYPHFAVLTFIQLNLPDRIFEIFTKLEEDLNQKFIPFQEQYVDFIHIVLEIVKKERHSCRLGKISMPN